MKYYFSINDRSFSNVSDIQINKSYRSESSFKSLGGDMLIDRVGDEKTDLKVKINQLSAEDMQFLRTCRRKMDISVQYYEDNTLVTKTMYLKAITEPAPIYYYGDRNKGIMYASITLSLTEL